MTQPAFTDVFSIEEIYKAVDILKHGGIIAYPTEAVYGLGCLPEHIPAIKRLLQIKQRSKEKGLILLASQWVQIEPYISELPTELRDKMNASWPGPITWLVPSAPTTSSWITGEFNSVAVRISAHSIVQEICQQSQSAIISTSANISNQAMIYNAQEVQHSFAKSIDGIIDAPLGKSTRPSQIIDVMTDQIIRN